jgi:ATP-dependent helicase/nuclease subunit A
MSERVREAISRSLPLGPDVFADEGASEAILERTGLPSRFPPLAALDDLRGKYWVTEFKRLGAGMEAEQIEDGGFGLWPEAPIQPEAQERAAALARGAAVRSGTLYHAALSRLDLRGADAAGLEAQLAAFSRSPWWEGEPRDLEIERGIAAFFRTPLGGALRKAAGKDVGSDAVEREIPFSLRWSLSALARHLPALRGAIRADRRWQAPEWSLALDQTWALLQGRIDCLFPSDEGWVLIDWKTDAVSADQAPARARLYASQMAIYREAVARMWGTPVKGWLVFLRPGLVLESGDDGEPGEPPGPPAGP